MCAINFGNMNIGSIPLPIRQEDIPGLIVKETEDEIIEKVISYNKQIFTDIFKMSK